MRSNFRLRRCVDTAWLAVLMMHAPIVAGQSTDHHLSSRKPTEMQDLSALWQVVDRLIDQIPFTKEKIEATLPTTLEETRRNQLMVYYKGTPVPVDSQLTIVDIDLRSHRLRPTPGFLVFDIKGACISRDMLRARYPDIRLIETPRGHSLLEEFVYSTDQPWGRLNFGFTAAHPECLAGMSFWPNRDDQPTGH